MATRELLHKLEFRGIPAVVEGIAKITVRHGTDLSATAGHTTAR
jgi:hypothetical protein